MPDKLGSRGDGTVGRLLEPEQVNPQCRPQPAAPQTVHPGPDVLGASFGGDDPPLPFCSDDDGLR
jgi:hypothetical protein